MQGHTKSHNSKQQQQQQQPAEQLEGTIELDQQPEGDDVGDIGQEARELMHVAAEKIRKPQVGAAIAGAVVLAAGALWGATEAAVAAVAAYAVFRMLRERRQRRVPSEARPAEGAT